MHTQGPDFKESDFFVCVWKYSLKVYVNVNLHFSFYFLFFSIYFY